MITAFFTSNYDMEYHVTLKDWETAHRRLDEMLHWAKENHIRDHITNFIISLGGFADNEPFTIAVPTRELAMEFVLRFADG